MRTSLTVLHDPLDVVERELDAPFLVEEDTEPHVVLRDEQAVLEELRPRLAVARLHACSVKSLPSDGWLNCMSLFV
jgi:hypothetical protein